MKIKAKLTVHDHIIDDNNHRNLSPGVIYYVVEIDSENFRVINDKGEPILYPKALFDIVDPYIPEDWVTKNFDDDEYFIGPSELSDIGFYEDYFDKVSYAVERFESFRKQLKLAS